jgi:polyene glycosyltransferase
MAALEGPILFASGANSGLINPLLAVVGELSRRGVEGLHFAADEPARRPVEAAATGSPIAFHPHAEQVAPLGDATYRAMTRGPGTTDGVVALVRQFRSPAVTEALFRRTLELIDRHRPRLMVIDVLSVGALDAAQRRGVPYVLSVSCPPSTVFVQRLPRDYPTPLTGLPLRMNRRQQISSLAFRVRLALAMLRTVDISDARRRKAEGIVNPYGDIERYAADAVSVFSYTVFGLEYPFPVPPRLHLLGPALPTSPDRPSGELADWLDRHESVVYVNMGTVSQLSAGQLGEIAAALGRIAGSHAVLWKLRDEQRALLPDVLPDAIRVTPWVPTQAEVLGHPHVRAVICHGGNNILHESIAYGQPVLVMPFWLDCYDLATRAADAGVGLAVDRPPHFDADEIVSKVARLLVDDAFRSRSRHWAGELRRAGGAARAADLIMGRSADSRPRHVATAEGGHRRGTMSATAIRPGAE